MRKKVKWWRAKINGVLFGDISCKWKIVAKAVSMCMVHDDILTNTKELQWNFRRNSGRRRILWKCGVSISWTTKKCSNWSIVQVTALRGTIDGWNIMCFDLCIPTLSYFQMEWKGRGNAKLKELKMSGRAVRFQRNLKVVHSFPPIPEEYSGLYAMKYNKNQPVSILHKRKEKNRCVD